MNNNFQAAKSDLIFQRLGHYMESGGDGVVDVMMHVYDLCLYVLMIRQLLTVITGILFV